MNYDQEMSSSRTTATELREQKKPSYKRWTRIIGGIILGSFLVISPYGPVETYVQWSKKDEQRQSNADAGPQVRWLPTPLTRTPEKTWPKLNLPANSKSEFLTLPLGMGGITVEGDGHRIESITKNGEVVGYYVYNDANLFRTFGYAFTPK
ncbi:MAG: hypothetical protein JWN18_684 [Parcubacteria group bacterium]|nr:hypothetical protein [Parcubacteria group bacterium]